MIHKVVQINHINIFTSNVIYNYIIIKSLYPYIIIDIIILIICYNTLHQI